MTVAIESNEARLMKRPSPSTGGSSWVPLVFALSVTAIYSLVAGFGLSRHELWHDEFQAWLIARDSHSFSDVLFNCRYEGTPPLWHFCLYAISRFSSDPHSMQVLNLSLNAAIVFLFTRFAPFPWYARVLFPFGYFMLFEYGLLSRSYTLGNFFLFAFCALWLARTRSQVPLYLVLSLLSLTSLFGTILAIALLAGLATEGLPAVISSTRQLRQTRHKKQVHSVIVNGFCAILLAFSIAISAWLIKPPSDGFGANRAEATIKQVGRSAVEAVRQKAKVAGTVLYSYFPVPRNQYNFWNTSAFSTDFYKISDEIALVGASLFLLFSLSFARKPMAFVSYAVGTTGMLLFSALFFVGSMRHFGQCFMLLAACHWFFESGRTWLRDNNFASSISNYARELTVPLFLSMLALHMVYGIYCYSMDFAYPFSQSKAVAEYLKSNGLASAPMVTAPDRIGTGVNALLNRKSIHLEKGAEGSFVISRPSEQVTSWAVTVPKLKEIVKQHNGSVLFLLIRPVPSNLFKDAGMKVQLLETFQNSLEETQDLFLYRVTQSSEAH